MCLKLIVWVGFAVVPCNTGLACLPLQAGGSAGSGVGYCTKLGLGQHTSDGAASIRVTTRKTTGGQSCRLPIVYKCADTSILVFAACINLLCMRTYSGCCHSKVCHHMGCLL